MPSVSPKNKSQCRGRKVESCERKKNCKKTVAGKRRSYCRSRKNKMLKKSAVVVSSPVEMVSPVVSPPKKVSRKNRELASLIGDLNLERGARRRK